MKIMTNTSKLAFIAILLFALPAYADSVAGGGSGSGSSSASADASKNMGCEQAGALRLVLASVAHTCKAAEAAKGGNAPQDNLGCGAPALSSISSSLAKYQWGGAASSSGSTMTVPSGLDCSGLISAASCRSGIPIKPGNPCAVIRTSEMDQLLSSGNSCYKPIDGSKKTGQACLAAGDLVEYQHGGGGHTYAIERVDPNNCKNLCIIQEESTATGGSIECTGGGPTGDAQGLSLDDVVKANCDGNSSSNAKTKVMTYDSTKKSGCAPQPAKQISNGPNCDVGNMPNG